VSSPRHAGETWQFAHARRATTKVWNETSPSAGRGPRPLRPPQRPTPARRRVDVRPVAARWARRRPGRPEPKSLGDRTGWNGFLHQRATHMALVWKHLVAEAPVGRAALKVGSVAAVRRLLATQLLFAPLSASAEDSRTAVRPTFVMQSRRTAAPKPIANRRHADGSAEHACSSDRAADSMKTI
jgi:hypothetical protein